MPEGPECRRQAVYLNGSTRNRTLKTVRFVGGRYTRAKPAGWDKFLKKKPIEVLGVRSHGKFIYWMLEGDCYLFTTLGMSGNFGTYDSNRTRVFYMFEKGKTIFYNDQRNFGTIKYVEGKEELEKKLMSLGPDPLSTNISEDTLKYQITKGKRKDKTIAEVLMDQKAIAGIGNYLKAEILWLSGISPHRTPGSLSDNEIHKLNFCIRNVMAESFWAKQGSSLLTYRNIRQDDGLQYPEGTLAVYRRSADPLGREIVGESTKDGRTTWWVPEAQK